MAAYACSDLHGRLDLVHKIQQFLKPDDIVYFLGDAGDRGPEPWKTIKAIVKDKRFIYLKGNHEDMLIKAMEDEIREECRGHNYTLLVYNGGGDTFLQWQQEEQKTGWWHYLKDFPTYKKYVNKSGVTIHLSHAGFNPQEYDAIPEDEDLLWGRDHFFTEHPIFEDNEICVHGHTPIPLLIQETTWRDKSVPQWLGNAYWYGDAHKVDLDCGSWYTDRAILLDLDTFEEIPIIADDAIDLTKEVL